MTWCKWPRRTKCGRLKCALLPQLGSMDFLLERSYLQTHSFYAGCGRSTLNFIECFLAWVGPFSLQVKREVYSNELWNELHNHGHMSVQKCTPMYSKRPTRDHHEPIRSSTPKKPKEETDCISWLGAFGPSNNRGWGHRIVSRVYGVIEILHHVCLW